MDLLVDLSSLSEDIREKLAELDLELSEGKVFNIKMELQIFRLGYYLWSVHFYQYAWKMHLVDGSIFFSHLTFCFDSIELINICLV